MGGLRQEADLKDRRLREEVQTWCGRRMAHRCDWGILALYRAPFDRCPNCGRLTLEDRRQRSKRTSEPQDLTPQVSTTTR